MNYTNAIVPSTGEVSPGNPLPITTFLTSTATANFTATTAGTSIVIPSTASGALYLTGLFASSGSIGTLAFGYGTGVVAPTGSALIIPALYVGANSTTNDLIGLQPVKIPSGNNFLVTITATSASSGYVGYYVAP